MSTNLRVADKLLTVTIVVPVFNGERYLLSTLQSCKDLRIPNGVSVSVVIVDDGSYDRSLEIAKDFCKIDDSDVKFETVSKTNGGESSAINFGAKSFPADYFIFLSCDDLIHSDLLLKSLPILIHNPQVVATYPDWYMIAPDGTELDRCETEEWTGKRQFGSLGNIPGPGAIIRGPEFEAIGGRSEEYGFFSDLEQWFRLAVRGDLRRVPQTLASWRAHDKNQSGTTDPVQMAHETLALAYRFRGWKTERAKDFEQSGKANAHFRTASLALSFKMPIQYGGRLHLFIGFLYYLSAKVTSKVYCPSHAVNRIEIIAIFLNPLGRLALNLRKARNF